VQYFSKRFPDLACAHGDLGTSRAEWLVAVTTKVGRVMTHCDMGGRRRRANRACRHASRGAG